jgi:uncharacterized protein YwqG
MQIGHGALDQAPPPLRTTLRRLLLPSLRLRSAGPTAPDSTGTRFGGLPLLAAGTGWPHSPSGQPQSFLAQLNSNDVSKLLPADTLLAFFYDVEEQPWGFDPADAGGWRVIATPVAEARPQSGPAEAFAPLAAVADPVDTVPDRWEEPIDEPASRNRSEHKEAYEEFYDAAERDDEIAVHRVFGWPEIIQNPMQRECQLASNGVNTGTPEGWRDPRVAELEPGAADWILLFQIDSDEDAGWMWGDAGRIYYWIRRQDLAAGVFDRVWLVLQCY